MERPGRQGIFVSSGILRQRARLLKPGRIEDFLVSGLRRQGNEHELSCLLFLRQSENKIFGYLPSFEKERLERQNMPSRLRDFGTEKPERENIWRYLKNLKPENLGDQNIDF